MTAKERRKVRKCVLAKIKIDPKTGKKVFTGNKAELKASGCLGSLIRKLYKKFGEAFSTRAMICFGVHHF